MAGSGSSILPAKEEVRATGGGGGGGGLFGRKGGEKGGGFEIGRAHV